MVAIKFVLMLETGTQKYVYMKVWKYNQITSCNRKQHIKFIHFETICANLLGDAVFFIISMWNNGYNFWLFPLYNGSGGSVEQWYAVLTSQRDIASTVTMVFNGRKKKSLTSNIGNNVQILLLASQNKRTRTCFLNDHFPATCLINEGSSIEIMETANKMQCSYMAQLHWDLEIYKMASSMVLKTVLVWKLKV